MMNRVTQFLRSVLPADPFQLCFLAGLVCLTIAPHLRWWPVEERADWSATLNGSLVPMEYYVVQVVATYGLILASSAGYFFCFWPGKRTKAKVWLSVVLPAAVSIALTSVAFLNIRRGEYSVLTQIHGSGKGLSWVVTELWHQGSGIHFAALGIGLTALFGLRLIGGTSDLPLELSSSSDIGELPQEQSKGNARLIWFSVAPSSSVIMAVVVFGLFAPLRLTSAYRAPKAWMGFLQAFVVAAAMLVLSMWLAGSENRKLVYGLVRRLNPKLILIGAVLPALVSLSPPIVRFIVDRISWAANDFGKYSPPHLLSYLPVPEIWTLSLVFAAFVEEIVFRGVLQRHFVIRLGVPRGIFLVGIVWASFHFFTDKYATSDQGVLLGLLLRVTQCVILGFVLSWLTLRSNSLFPATMAHWLSNVGVYSSRDPAFPGRVWMNPLLWLVVALVLFRFWPVEDSHLTAPVAETIDMQPNGGIECNGPTTG